MATKGKSKPKPKPKATLRPVQAKAKARKNSKPSNMEPEPGYLPDMAPQRNAKVHAAAERLNETLEELGDIRGKKKDREAKLIEIMESEGIDFYRFGKVKCKIKIKKTVNVKEVGEEDEEKKGINPDSNGAEGEDLDKEPEPAGTSEVLEGIKELAEETADKQ